MEVIEGDRKRKAIDVQGSSDDDEVTSSLAKKYKDSPESASSCDSVKDDQIKTKQDPNYDFSDDEEDTIFGAVKTHDEELNISEFRGTSSVGVLDDYEQSGILASGFSCFLNEDGDMVLDQISATFNNNFARDEYFIQPIIQEAPESPTLLSPQHSPQSITRSDSGTLPSANRKIPTSSWYSLIQDALDNMDGEATAREMVEYFEKNHKSHPFMKKTHWKQTVYTYLSKYFEKKFVGGSRDTIYTYTKTTDDGSEAKSIAKKKSKKNSTSRVGPDSRSDLASDSVTPVPRITRSIQSQINESIVQPYYMPRVPPIK